MNAAESVPVPPEFAKVFSRLVRRTQVPGGRLDPQACADYWTALRDVPMDALAESADALARSEVFFPTVAEWRRAAGPPHAAAGAPCPTCAGQGVVRIAYKSLEPFDLAICLCRAGDVYRRFPDAVLRARLALGPEARIADLDAFEDPA